MAGAVLFVNDFGDWYASTTHEQRGQVDDALRRFAANPVQPSVEVKSFGASFPALRRIVEMVVSQGKHPIRIFYAFDGARDAILLTGGSKKGAAGARGTSQSKWNVDMATRALGVFNEYLLGVGQGQRTARPLAELQHPEDAAPPGADEKTVREVVKATGWTTYDVHKLMRPGAALDPNSDEGMARIIALLDKAKGFDGLSAAPVTYRTYARLGQTVTVSAQAARLCAEHGDCRRARRYLHAARTALRRLHEHAAATPRTPALRKVVEILRGVLASAFHAVGEHCGPRDVHRLDGLGMPLRTADWAIRCRSGHVRIAIYPQAQRHVARVFALRNGRPVRVFQMTTDTTTEHVTPYRLARNALAAAAMEGKVRPHEFEHDGRLPVVHCTRPFAPPAPDHRYDRGL